MKLEMVVPGAPDREWRVFVGWTNGAFVNSLDPQFHSRLNEMVRQFGPPAHVLAGPVAYQSLEKTDAK